MENRRRDIQIKFYVDKEENALINERFREANMTNKGAYLRKMAIDGFIINIDTSDLRSAAKEISSISRNINQIARAVNTSDYLSYRTLEDVRSGIERIWQLLRSTLSNTLSASQ